MNANDKIHPITGAQPVHEPHRPMASRDVLLAGPIRGSRVPSYFARCVSVYAVCTLLAAPALGQSPASKAKSEPPRSAAAKSTPTPTTDEHEVKVYDYGNVDISVKDTDLATVLEMLSIESKRNIIASKGVSATVTANLYDVTFAEALKAILDVNGLTHEFITPLLSEVGKASARGDVQPGMKPDVTNGGADTFAFNAKLVVNDYPDNLNAIASLLANLDIPPSQVLVETTILQTALDEANAFGVDFTVLGSLNFTDITNPLSAVSSLLAGKEPTNGFQPTDNNAHAATSTVGNTGGPGGLKIGVLSDDIAVFLRVLDEVTDSTVLARPKVMALNRQRAQILVGARIGYLSTTATETTTTQSVEFLDTGVHLVFRPFIAPDGMIRMELSPSVSEASLRSVTDANGQIVTIPDELTNEITTNVRVKDGQTLVLGGLFKESNRITRRQVPLLGDIPVLGAAFRGQDDKVQRSEIIFLITPSIVRDQTLWAMGKDHMDAVDSLRVGARSNLLPFSNDKITSNYNQKAQDAFNRGDSKKALHYINCSLCIYPNQPEMIRLREKITSQSAKIHERSLMERIFRKEIGPLSSADGHTDPTTTQTAEVVDGAMETTTTDATGIDDTMEPTTTEPAAVADNTMETSTDESAGSQGVADATSPEQISAQAPEPMTDSAEGQVTTVTQEPVPQSMDMSAADPNEVIFDPSAEATESSPSHTTSVDSSAPQPEALSPNSSASAAGKVDGSQKIYAAQSKVASQSQAVSSMSSGQVGAAASTVSAVDNWTPERQLRQQQFLYDFFMALGMPHFAVQYACSDESSDSTFPFTTFDDMGKTAGVTDTNDPMK
jgi:type IV pilus assembly protein PilQ